MTQVPLKSHGPATSRLANSVVPAAVGVRAAHQRLSAGSSARPAPAPSVSVSQCRPRLDARNRRIARPAGPRRLAEVPGGIVREVRVALPAHLRQPGGDGELQRPPPRDCLSAAVQSRFQCTVISAFGRMS